MLVTGTTGNSGSFGTDSLVDYGAIVAGDVV